MGSFNLGVEESLIGLAGFTDDCGSDDTAVQGARPWIDKGAEKMTWEDIFSMQRT